MWNENFNLPQFFVYKNRSQHKWWWTHLCTFTIERFNLVLASIKLKFKHFSFQFFGYKKLKQWLVLMDFSSLKPVILLPFAIFYDSYLHAIYSF